MSKPVFFTEKSVRELWERVQADPVLRERCELFMKKIAKGEPVSPELARQVGQGLLPD